MKVFKIEFQFDPFSEEIPPPIYVEAGLFSVEGGNLLLFKEAEARIDRAYEPARLFMAFARGNWSSVTEVKAGDTPEKEQAS